MSTISSVACQDSEGLQSLHVASQHGQLAMVEALLSIGASVNARTTLQQPVVIAATCCAYDGEAAAACLRCFWITGGWAAVTRPATRRFTLPCEVRLPPKRASWSVYLFSAIEAPLFSSRTSMASRPSTWRLVQHQVSSTKVYEQAAQGPRWRTPRMPRSAARAARTVSGV